MTIRYTCCNTALVVCEGHGDCGQSQGSGLRRQWGSERAARVVHSTMAKVKDGTIEGAGEVAASIGRGCSKEGASGGGLAMLHPYPAPELRSSVREPPVLMATEGI